MRIIITGLVMGIAEVIPGVSGGTIAFVSGIYERLIMAFHQFRPEVLLQLPRLGAGEIWRRVDGTFLALLFAAMGVSIVGFARAVSWLLANEPIIIWSFFFGLVVASCFIVAGQIRQVTGAIVSAGTTGLIIGLIITQLVPMQLTPSPMTLFAGGAVAVCAWVLPGMSGSFILLIIGLYAFVIEAVKNLDIASLAWLGLGCALGLMAFSQVLARLFRWYRNETLALLTGFMTGSLVKLWPWKVTLSYQMQADGSRIPLMQEPVLPMEYLSATGAEPQLILALVTATVGCGLVMLLDYLWLAGHRAQSYR
ncbi:MAG: DUF368 domain-containing protein [Gammaproteobacteria bacterium]|nr:DUF368 domain-containing protein [Gammaproteobacteria bacterium]